MVNTNPLEKEVTKIFKGMTDVVENQARSQALYIAIMKNQEDYLSDPTALDLLTRYQFEPSITQAIIDAKKPLAEYESKYADLYINYVLYCEHLTQFFIKHEGHAASADKANTILEGYLEILQSGVTKAWPVEEERNWTLPAKGSVDDWFGFVDSLIYLRVGRPEKYLQAYTKMSGLYQNNDGV